MKKPKERAADRRADVKRPARGRGRPTAYRPEFADLGRKFCLLGATNEELAKLFDVATSTIGKWIAEVPQFSDAIKEGRVVADATVANSLYRRANGYSHKAVKILQSDGQPVYAPYTEHYPPDPTSCIFWLKNRRRGDWREKIEHEHSASEDMLKILEAGRERVRVAGDARAVFLPVESI